MIITHHFHILIILWTWLRFSFRDLNTSWRDIFKSKNLPFHLEIVKLLQGVVYRFRVWNTKANTWPKFDLSWSVSFKSPFVRLMYTVHVLILFHYSVVDFTYYVTPGTNCLEVHRVHNLPDQHAHLFQWTCPKGTAFDLSICGCNHWYMIQLQSKCTSSWFKWNGK